jgi:hypothetical protein
MMECCSSHRYRGRYTARGSSGVPSSKARTCKEKMLQGPNIAQSTTESFTTRFTLLLQGHRRPRVKSTRSHRMVMASDRSEQLSEICGDLGPSALQTSSFRRILSCAPLLMRVEHLLMVPALHELPVLGAWLLCSR